MEVTKKPALGDEKRESSRQSYRPGPFDYQRLDAFRVAREALVRGQQLVRRLPRGQRKLADQLWRALLGAYLQVAEGASASASIAARGAVLLRYFRQGTTCPAAL